MTPAPKKGSFLIAPSKERLQMGVSWSLQHTIKAYSLQNSSHKTKRPGMSLESRANTEQDSRSHNRPPCVSTSEMTTPYPFWVSTPQEADRLERSNIFLTKTCWKKTNIKEADASLRHHSSLPLSNSYHKDASIWFLCLTRLPPSKLLTFF